MDDETRALVAPAVEAFETAVIELGNIHRLRLAADKNAALTPEAKVLQVSAYADKKVAHVARMIDAAHEGLKTNIKNAETALNAPLEQSVAQPIAQEIRAFAKAMTAGERRKFLTDSIASNDKAALSALLGGPHYLSGLTLLEKEQFTRLHREKAYPAVANRLRVMQTAVAIVQERGGLIHQEAQKAIGSDYRKIRALKDAQTTFTKALAK